MYDAAMLNTAVDVPEVVTNTRIDVFIRKPRTKTHDTPAGEFLTSVLQILIVGDFLDSEEGANAERCVCGKISSVSHFKPPLFSFCVPSHPPGDGEARLGKFFAGCVLKCQKCCLPGMRYVVVASGSEPVVTC